MNNPDIDISVIVTAHNEGRLVHQTMRSILQAIDKAENTGIMCEIIAVLDKPTSETLQYFTD